MSKLNLENIKDLENLKSDPSITIIVPTSRLMPDRQKDPISVKNAIKEAANKLLSKYNRDEVWPIIERLDELAQSIDYSQALDSLAIFINKEFSGIFYLPFKLKQKITVNKSFDSGQILRAIKQSPQYWILAISHKPTRLFSAVKDAINEKTETVEKEQKETGFPFYWHFEVTSDSELLGVGQGYKDSMYLTAKDSDFMHDIDKRLDNYLIDNDDPLILMGTTENIADFKKISKYRNRIIGSKEGDYANANISQVAKHSWQVMQQYLTHEQKALFKLIDEAESEKKLSTGIEDVLGVANAGQVRVLIVEENAEISGRDISQKMLNGFDQDNIIDYVIDKVYEKDGSVVFVPEGKLEDFGKVCAVLRYK